VSEREPRTRSTGYTTGEAKCLVAGLVGWDDPTEIRAFVVLAIDQHGKAGLGGTPNITPEQIPDLFRRAAKAYADDLAKDE
jgi:hypothetical protein